MLYVLYIPQPLNTCAFHIFSVQHYSTLRIVHCDAGRRCYEEEESDKDGVEEDRIVEEVESKSEEGGSVAGSLDRDFEEVLQMEQNWGKSQCLFDPLHPFMD